MSEPALEPKRGLLQRLSDLFSDEPADQAELQEMLQGAAERQLLGTDALNMIFGALNVANMHARDIMIPRSQMVVVKADSKPDELLH